MTDFYESRTWPEMVESYRGLAEGGGHQGPMLDLVEFIAGSPYASGLFPLESMFELCLSRTRGVRWRHGMLSILYDASVGQFVFTYFEESMWPEPWVTRRDTELGREHFEWLMKKRLRWFRDVRSTTGA